QQLYTVPLQGGFPSKLPVPHGNEASLSPDATQIAYVPQRDATGQRKNCRGGMRSEIWIQRLKDNAVEKVPQPPSKCNDQSPRWMGNTLYFRSDRNGEFNLFAYDPATKDVKQLTHFLDFPVLGLGVGGGNIVFEQ